MTTAIAPYQSAAQPGRAGFAQLLHAEWTKFRTVRGWVAGLLLAGLLMVAVGLLNHSQCGVATMNANGTEQTSGCPASPIGPGGEAVTDNFYFVHQALPANGTITARVTSLTGLYSPSGGVSAGAAGASPLAGFVSGVQPWAKAGIMIKASVSPGAAYAAMLVTGGNGVRMQDNFTGDTAGLPGPVTAASPRWLRLVRSGDTVTGYDSADGTSWTSIGRVTLPGVTATAQVGLFAASPGYTVTSTSFGGSHSGGGPTLATAAFDHLALSGTGGAWAGTSVGNGGPAGAPLPPSNDPFLGSYKSSGGTYTVSGSGDIAPDVPGASDSNGTNITAALGTSAFFALIAMVVVGAMFITAEYRRGLIKTTFAASPRRGRVLAAKAVVLGGVTFLVGLAGIAVALPVTEAVLRSGGNWILPLPVLTTVRLMVGTAAVLAVAAVLALAIGTIARRGVAAVSTVIVLITLPFLFAVIPGILPSGAQDWMLRVFPAAGLAVTQALPRYHQVFTGYTSADGYYPLPGWAGFAVLCVWAAVALAAAGYLVRRRDA